MKRAALILLALPGLAHAWVEAARLEYSCTKPAKFYLNGVELKNQESAFPHPYDWALISSVDGALPLGSLRYGAENNVLAVHLKAGMQTDRRSSELAVSYRLTLRLSGGQTVLVESWPKDAKAMFLQPEQEPPQGWNLPSYADASWVEPKTVRVVYNACAWPLIKDLRPGAHPDSVLPFITKNRTGNSEGGDAYLFRNSFQLPAAQGQLRVHSYQAAARKGDKVAMALLPDRSAAAMGDLEVAMLFPAGLDPMASPGARWDAAKRVMSWRYPSPAKTVSLHLESVAENRGFKDPQRCLGPWRTDRTYKNLMTNALQDFYSGTGVETHGGAWYKVSPPPFKDGPGAPQILGVSFQSQMNPGGMLGEMGVVGVDKIHLNYSVDGSLNPALKDGAYLSGTYGGACGGGWANMNLDDERGRRWTWSDLSRLRVLLEARPNGPKNAGSLLSFIVSVRYLEPGAAMPRFYAQVSAGHCAQLPIRAWAKSLQGGALAQGTLTLPVNCAK